MHLPTIAIPIVNSIKKELNNNLYTTELKEKYWDQGFRYPGFDYKYNTKRPNSNDLYRKLQINENGVTKTINLAEQLHLK